MALLINWLNAIAALVVLGLFYNDAPYLNPLQAVFVSLSALVFLILAYILRVNSMKIIPLSRWQALLGLIVVLIVVGAGVYFALPQIPHFTIPGQYAALVWFFIIDFLAIVEAIMSFRNRKHPQLEKQLEKLEQEQL